MHVVINHLRLREPVSDATVEAMREGMHLVVDAGGLAGRVAKVDETHLILILEFSYGEVPWRAELIDPPEQIVDSAIPLSERPGFGITINERTARKYAVP